MLKAFQIISSLIPQLKHNHCIAHILNLVGETWIHYKNFQFLVNVVKNIKATFVQCPAHKRHWISFLKSNFNSDLDNDNTQITLPPLPVKSRWNSWFRFVFWINQNINQLRLFYLEEEQVNNESQAIQELASIFNNYTNTFIFEILTMFISFNARW